MHPPLRKGGKHQQTRDRQRDCDCQRQPRPITHLLPGPQVGRRFNLRTGREFQKKRGNRAQAGTCRRQSEVGEPRREKGSPGVVRGPGLPDGSAGARIATSLWNYNQNKLPISKVERRGRPPKSVLESARTKLRLTRRMQPSAFGLGDQARGTMAAAEQHECSESLP
jgi:hypothetical protein